MILPPVDTDNLKYLLIIISGVLSKETFLSKHSFLSLRDKTLQFDTIGPSLTFWHFASSDNDAEGGGSVLGAA